MKKFLLILNPRILIFLFIIFLLSLIALIPSSHFIIDIVSQFVIQYYRLGIIFLIYSIVSFIFIKDKKIMGDVLRNFFR